MYQSACGAKLSLCPLLNSLLIKKIVQLLDEP